MPLKISGASATAEATLTMAPIATVCKRLRCRHGQAVGSRDIDRDHMVEVGDVLSQQALPGSDARIVDEERDRRIVSQTLLDVLHIAGDAQISSQCFRFNPMRIGKLCSKRGKALLVASDHSRSYPRAASLRA